MTPPKVGSVAFRVILDLSLMPRGSVMWSKEISDKYGVHIKAMHQSLRRSHENGWLKRHKVKGDNELYWSAGPELEKVMNR